MAQQGVTSRRGALDKIAEANDGSEFMMITVGNCPAQDGLPQMSYSNGFDNFEDANLEHRDMAEDG